MSNLYYYNGPVNYFGRCIVEKYEGYTNAVSEGKAKSNLAFRFKMTNQLSKNARISLPGKIEIVEE